MNLLSTLQSDLVSALKNRDGVKVSTLRFLIAQINNARIAKGADLTDEEIVGEIVNQAKKHRESIEAFDKGNRTDLAQKEKLELVILEAYLPKQLPEGEITKLVDETIAEVGASGSQDVGKVMQKLMPKVKGKADGLTVASLVKSKLG